jgi:uncharacterized coiled-coil DUF342 family protein
MDDERIAVTDKVWLNVIEITKQRDELRDELAETHSQITTLEWQLSEATKAAEQLTGELERLNQHYQALMTECDRKYAEIQQLRLELQRLGKSNG